MLAYYPALQEFAIKEDLAQAALRVSQAKDALAKSQLAIATAKKKGEEKSLAGLVAAAEIATKQVATARAAQSSLAARVAAEKARGLRQLYGADEKTCGYFSLHMTADLYRSRIWRHQLAKLVEANPAAAEKALVAGENAAKALWRALDGIEAARLARAA